MKSKWKCSNCQEEHDEQFDTCWKCGYFSTGKRNPQFQISEPITKVNQAPEGEEQQPELSLPTVIYFYITPCVLFQLIATRIHLERVGDVFRPGAMFTVEIALAAAATLPVFVPVFACVLRTMFHRLCHRTLGSSSWSPSISESFSDALWFLSIFRLPESFCKQFGWYIPVYYISICVWLVAPLIFFLIEAAQPIHLLLKALQ